MLNKLKQKKKILIVFLVSILGIFITYSVVAEEKLEVVKVYGVDGNYAALYSDDKLYTWGYESNNTIYENVDDFVWFNHVIVYNDKDGNLFTSAYPYQDSVVFENVDKIYKFNDAVGFFVTKDFKLYGIDYRGYNNDILESFEGEEHIYFIMDNVKEISVIFDEYILIKDNNDNLYALGKNRFGKKINDGNYLHNVTKVLDNVKEYGDGYIIDKNNDLYVYSINLPKPMILSNNISNVLFSDCDGYSNGVLSYVDNNNVGNYIDYFINDDKIEIENSYVLENKRITNMYRGDGLFYLIDDKLYYKYNYTIYDEEYDEYKSVQFNDVVLENVVKMNDAFVLTEEGTFYTLDVSSYDRGLSNVKDVIVNKYVYKIMENVKDFMYVDYWNCPPVFLIMEDDTVMAFGYTDEYSNLFNDTSISSSGIPVLVKGLPNVNETINVYDIQLSTSEKTKFTVGDTVDYYVNIFPYNATDKSVIWESSNEEVAVVDEEGFVTTKGVGSTVISVKTKDGLIVRSQEINVYPKVGSVEITNGDSADLELYEYVILTADVKPEDTLEKELEWSVSDDEKVWLTKYYSVCEDTDNHYGCTEHRVKSNQIVVRVRAGGTYTVTAKTANGLYSDSITINTVEKVSNIELDIDDEYYDGVNNAFIYLSESPTLQVGYKIYPTTATNQNVTWSSSDTDVATVDSTGKITAYKTGRARITISSVDGGDKRTFNLLVYDYLQDNVIVGDVTGDGEVNILDLIRLRRYLAGLEESLQ